MGILHLNLNRRSHHHPLSFWVTASESESEMGNSSRDDSATDGDASSGGGGDAPKPSNSSLYSEGEKILAYHGPRIYEAKASEPLASLSPCPSFPNYAFFLVLCFALVCGILVAEWFGILRLGFEIFSLQSLVRFLFLFWFANFWIFFFRKKEKERCMELLIYYFAHNFNL